ncbi:Rho-binding antiterminator [Xenorhabdus nematophila]|uniref:Modulator of Rho-dependent transcription termination n=1 Tax=Xenorhabdus nematophila (strain ATCC 19061 / DSM 3370 / CCUG 14189 / LMG 1036 / NCIMB 9965 / AN6) TaxID=406817 RepID=D3VCH7_XENNA|nr:Rho-binding antiterminator [Xenorhabdus nematophila]CEF28893.1 modulator of Rho-dependent transcription termination [Xenorhabdus nematophila str. Websteri]AYA42172.1 Rho-binding antiterminator [Xenorhabdus nematophila]KHD29639.1 Rho-binding antiterminator [Xenorhabdus nematophila]MBA0020898.1 Rho-binding antiterminator [Xenorhabdus nematophila]MCB4424145.1 Rho-binding antiterminator [Xenorhabdus nematophila]
MSIDNKEYQPINCDDYDNLELACQRQLHLSVQLREGELVEGKAKILILRKKVEYLLIESNKETRELRLDHIISFSNPEIGTIIIEHS